MMFVLGQATPLLKNLPPVECNDHAHCRKEKNSDCPHRFGTLDPAKDFIGTFFEKKKNCSLCLKFFLTDSTDFQ